MGSLVKDVGMDALSVAFTAYWIQGPGKGKAPSKPGVMTANNDPKGENTVAKFKEVLDEWVKAFELARGHVAGRP
jgi:hypothetical protein